MKQNKFVNQDKVELHNSVKQEDKEDIEFIVSVLDFNKELMDFWKLLIEDEDNYWSDWSQPMLVKMPKNIMV